MLLELPDPGLVLLVGAAGAGKTTFATRHFATTEVVSSDACRALVLDDAADQSANADAFQVLHLIAELRLRHGRFSVVDATNVQLEARRRLLELAHAAGAPATAIVLDPPEEVCLARNRQRPGRTVPARAVRRQLADLRLTLPAIAGEGFQAVWVLRDAASVDEVTISRLPARRPSPAE